MRRSYHRLRPKAAMIRQTQRNSRPIMVGSSLRNSVLTAKKIISSHAVLSLWYHRVHHHSVDKRDPQCVIGTRRKRILSAVESWDGYRHQIPTSRSARIPYVYRLQAYSSTHSFPSDFLLYSNNHAILITLTIELGTCIKLSILILRKSTARLVC